MGTSDAPSGLSPLTPRASRARHSYGRVRADGAHPDRRADRFATRRQAAATAGDEAAFVAALNNVRVERGTPAAHGRRPVGEPGPGPRPGHGRRRPASSTPPRSAPGTPARGCKMGENVGSGRERVEPRQRLRGEPRPLRQHRRPRLHRDRGGRRVGRAKLLYTTHRFLQVPGTQRQRQRQPRNHRTNHATTTTNANPATTTPDATTHHAQHLPRPAALAPADVDASRIVTLLEMLERVGT